MKLWQSQLEGDKLGGEAEETEEARETEETEEETDESHEEEGGGEDESEKEEHVGDDTNLLKEDEEEEDAESFGYEKIEKSEVEQLDCSSVRNRFESIIIFYSRVVVVGDLSQ